MGQDLDQSDNPFAVGDKVIIAILPHENANKLMAKWKGPFTVTKIPNRFQIEYLDGSVTRLTHISYAKKYNERCHYTEQVGVPRQTRVSRCKPRVRMARIRLIAGSGNRRLRMVFHSMKAIQDKWPVQSGRIRVRILGEAKDLPMDLQAIVEATGPDKCIEGSVLVDLCRQRSGRRESGCDAPNASEEFPTPVASPPRSPTPPAAQVRQYSWRHYAKKKVCLYDIRREFVGANKQTNRASPFLSQQAPLVAKAHLMAVVRRVEKRERTKGKQLGEFVFKDLPQSRGKNLTTLVPSRQKSERERQQYSVIRDNAERINSELNQLVHVPQYENNIHTLKPLKTRKEEGNLKFKCPGATSCQNSSDVIVNKPVVARERCTQKKHSLVSKKGFLKSTLSMCSQTFTKVALMLAVNEALFCTGVTTLLRDPWGGLSLVPLITNAFAYFAWII